MCLRRNPPAKKDAGKDAGRKARLRARLPKWSPARRGLVCPQSVWPEGSRPGSSERGRVGHRWDPTGLVKGRRKSWEDFFFFFFFCREVHDSFTFLKR